MRTTPVRLAIVDDYEVVVAGVASMFVPYANRIEVVELAANEPVTTPVDIALFDTFAQGEANSADLDVLLANPLAGRVVVYTWRFDPDLTGTALAKGAAGYLSKRLSAGELVVALERVHHGEVVVAGEEVAEPPTDVGVQDWPGRNEGLTPRESEMLALITQGRSNAEICAMTYLSPNSVKTYIRSAYAKIGAKSRTQAVLWGVEHGLHLGRRRIDTWKAAPRGSS